MSQGHYSKVPDVKLPFPEFQAWKPMGFIGSLQTKMRMIKGS